MSQRLVRRFRFAILLLMRKLLPLWVMLLALCGGAAERKFDFTSCKTNEAPPGFRSAVTGQGNPGDWRVIIDESSDSGTTNAAERTGSAARPVLAQLATDPTDEHFPVLIFEHETYGDFTLTTRFKTVRGVQEQMAGIAFRIQDETNYYVVRASSLGSTFRLYKVINGQRGEMHGPEIPVSSGVWHQMTIEAKGNRFRCELDGQEVIPLVTDNSPFNTGKIGFWTKSDSVSYFAGTKIVYTPRESPLQPAVRDLSKKYPRLLALKVYVPGTAPGSTRVVASKDEKDIGQAGGKTETGVIADSQIYYGKEKDQVSVILPLRDRNGDAIGAVRVVTKSFTGQTEQNAIVRATPILEALQDRAQSLRDIIQ